MHLLSRYQHLMRGGGFVRLKILTDLRLMLERGKQGFEGYASGGFDARGLAVH
jgi:hypothetical protein